MHFIRRNDRGTRTGSTVNAATDTRSGRSNETAGTADDSWNHAANPKPRSTSGSAADKSCHTSGINPDANASAQSYAAK